MYIKFLPFYVRKTRRSSARQARISKTKELNLCKIFPTTIFHKIRQNGNIMDYLKVDVPKIKIIRTSRKSISLQILRDATIEVKAPHLIPKFLIEQFIKSHEEWIRVRQDLVLNNIKKPREFSDGESFLYLGVEYILKIGNYTEIKIFDDKLLFPSALVFRGRDAIEKWYIRQAKKIINEQVAYYSNKMNASYTSISFSDTKSKWGSCTHDNRLQFNWRLVMTPLLVLRYVVLHELVHTTTKNHSYAFWSKVRSVNPSYKQQIKWLKLYGNGLTI